MQRILLRAIAIFATAVAGSALAAGLSPIQVQSGLGQPFSAEVELQGLTADDMLTAQTRIASREEYEKAGVPMISVIHSMRVSIVERAKDKWFLKLTSSAPVNEPAITLMVEFSWRGGRILQKYPVLLDPPKV
ncbi:MAG: hypothetical protein JNK75_10220 [Betaproteobacteria bacterium]|nr:hypothetical protein [Betaproteobacteria bacterium]